MLKTDEFASLCVHFALRDLRVFEFFDYIFEWYLLFTQPFDENMLTII